MRVCLSFMIVALLVRPELLPAQAPTITRITPRSVSPTEPRTLTISGNHLQPSVHLFATFPQIAKNRGYNEKNGDFKFEVEIADDQPCGIHAVRVLAKGVSNPYPFVVDSLPVIAHSNNNKSPETAQAIPAACAVEGHIDNLSRVYYRFPGKAEQSIALEVLARRLGSPLDPIVRLFDPNGREIAWSDDELALQGDCYLQTTLPIDGDYTVEVADVRYQGSGNHFFRLRIGQFEIVNCSYPLVVSSEKGTTYELVGPTPESSLSLEVTEELFHHIRAYDQVTQSEPLWIIPPQRTDERPQNWKQTLWPAVGFTSRPQILEQEPNDRPQQSQRVELGHDLNGRSDQPGDIDRFIFTAKKGQKFTFEAITRSAGSPTDLTMRILKPDGGQLVAAEDSGLRDGRMDATFPTDGDYVLEVRDLHRRGGSSFVWHVRVTETQPSFKLQASLDTVNVPTGGYAAIPVTVQRQGYNGPIEIEAKGLRAHIFSLPTIIGPGRNEAILTLRAEPDQQTWGIGISPYIEGTAEINGRKVSQVASLHDRLKSTMSNLPWPSRNLLYFHAAAISPAAPVNLRIEPEKVIFGRDLSAKFKVIAERKEGWDGDIALAVNPPKTGLPGNITLNPQPIKKGTNEVELTISANDKAALGRFTIGLNGTIKKDKVTSVQPTPGLTIELQAPLTVSVEPPSGTITRGGELKLDVTIKRNPALTAPVTITALKLPKGVTAEPITLNADQSSGQIVLKADADAANGDVKTLQIKAEAKVGKTTFNAVSKNLAVKVE